ncbi:MAG: sigma-70 family RNA polymerase sigma factor [Actinomycetota bacterium]|nr:sigma-70 family RNA polymerase sigma factor [Actinomycetota bacterium]
MDRDGLVDPVIPEANLANIRRSDLARLDERELTLAFQRGEDGAYDEVFRRYQPRVQNVCKRMLQRTDEAQEAAQETFLRVFTSLGAFNGRYQLGAWIARIATNVCLDHIRAADRRPSNSMPFDELDLLEAAPEHGDPEGFVLRRTESRRVRRVLAQLPPMHRAAIVLREFEGLSYCEIASALSLTEAQVKALIHRARKGFRRSWGDAAWLLLPARLWDRVRPLEPRDTASMMASGTQTISACSALLQSCGQFVGERVTPVLLGVMLGAGAIGGAVGAESAPQPSVAAQPQAERQLVPLPQAKQHRRPQKDGTALQVVTPTSLQPEGAPSPVETPATTPSPAASPPEQPAAQATPSPKPSPTSTDTPAPATPPTPPALGFDRGGPIPSAQPKTSVVSVDCDTMKVHQRLDTTIHDGDSVHPALFVFTSGAVELTVWKNGHEVGYTGGASLVKKSSSKGALALSYRGSYGWNGTGHPKNVNLPDSGRLEVDLILDCTKGSVVTETVVFGVV